MFTEVQKKFPYDIDDAEWEYKDEVLRYRFAMYDVPRESLSDLKSYVDMTLKVATGQESDAGVFTQGTNSWGADVLSIDGIIYFDEDD